MIDLPENELLMRARAGDTDAENQLIEQTQGRVVFSHDRRHGDSRQAARIGVWKAIQKFEGRNECSMTSYATWWMKGMMLRERARANACAATDRKYFEQFSGHHDETTPEDVVGRRDLAAKVKQLIGKCTELDALDLAVIDNRLLDQRMTLVEIAAAHGVSHQTIANRERRLVETTLPRILSSLRSAI